MPRPVDAFPWGSRSTISTRSPSSAIPAPRLTAVVLLPTPPFWFATAITRAPPPGWEDLAGARRGVFAAALRAGLAVGGGSLGVEDEGAGRVEGEGFVTAGP